MERTIKSYSRLLVSISVFALAAVAFLPSVKAESTICDPMKEAYRKTLSSSTPGIVTTTLTHTTAFIIEWPFTVATGSSMREFMGCTDYIADQMPAGSVQTEMKSMGCNGTADTQVCAGITNQLVAMDGTIDKAAFARSEVSGSLLGYVYTLGNALKYEPVPVNMAYFFKDYAYRLPIVGDKVLAADTVDYRHTLINSILNIWKITRNVAYAMMSLIMLWTGIAIITRKKINPQLSVTVTYALPKIVIALILISFSYPIGALLTSLSWSLFHSVDAILRTISGTSFDWATAGVAGGSIAGPVITLLIIIFTASGAGVALLIVGAAIVIIVLLLWLWAYIKAILVFIKMVAGIAFSPIQIALYAIPGNDDMLPRLIKQMVSWGLGIVGIATVIQLTMIFGGQLIQSSLSGTEPTSGTIIAVLAIPLVYIYGFGFASRVPGIIENAIVGPPPRKK